MDESLFDVMCECLRFVFCIEGIYIFWEGDLVNEMFFVICGELKSEIMNGGWIGFYNKVVFFSGDFCGEELFIWVLDFKF